MIYSADNILLTTAHCDVLEMTLEYLERYLLANVLKEA